MKIRSNYGGCLSGARDLVSPFLPKDELEQERASSRAHAASGLHAVRSCPEAVGPRSLPVTYIIPAEAQAVRAAACSAQMTLTRMRLVEFPGQQQPLQPQQHPMASIPTTPAAAAETKTISIHIHPMH